MRRELEKKGLMGVKVLEGEATNMSGVESQSVDAVIVAQVRPLSFTALLIQACCPDIGAICRHFIGMADKAVFDDFSDCDRSC